VIVSGFTRPEFKVEIEVVAAALRDETRPVETFGRPSEGNHHVRRESHRDHRPVAELVRRETVKNGIERACKRNVQTAWVQNQTVTVENDG
jgi:hypothetical protein